jgi:hypothetical protein
VRKAWLRLAAFGIGLVLLELALQLLALAGSPVARGDTGGPWNAGGEGRVVLCLGDSNTYGFAVSESAAWPAQLAGVLAERATDGPFRVVNLGLPGLNSRQVARQLEEELERKSADVVLVNVGVNNQWSWVPDSRLEVRAPPWYERLRTTRLLRVTFSAFFAQPDRPRGGRAPDVLLPGDMQTELREGGRGGRVVGRDRGGREVAFDTGSVPAGLSEERSFEALLADVQEMRELVEPSGAALLLVGYASERSAYRAANEQLRRVASMAGLPLVDCGRSLAELEGRLGFEQVFFPDYHAREVGYAGIARLVYGELVALGIAHGEAIDDPLASLAARERPPAPIHLEGRLDAAADSPDALRIEVRGEEPGRPFQVVLSLDGDGTTALIGDMSVPLADDELFRFTVGSALFRAETDARGNGVVPLAPLLSGERREGLRGLKLRAIYALCTERETLDVRWISDAVVLEIR